MSGNVTSLRGSQRLEARLLMVLAFARARGFSLRALGFYLGLWALIALVSRFSMSALGLQFAPPGSSSLDTVAVIFTILPAAVLGISTTSRTPELEAVRARSVYAAQSVWMLIILGGGTLATWVTAFALPPSIDRRSFFATWFLVLSTVLVISAISTVTIASLCSTGVVAAFSTPGLVPWEHNVMYNVATADLSTWLGVSLLVVGAFLQVVRHSRGSAVRSADAR